jgi:hypothetical protein
VADNKSKKKATNVHERLQSSLLKFRENLDKINEQTGKSERKDDEKSK